MNISLVAGKSFLTRLKDLNRYWLSLRNYDDESESGGVRVLRLRDDSICSHGIHSWGILLQPIESQ
jgi:hypothetical protein